MCPSFNFRRYPVFENLYEICSSNPISKTAYLESLEPFILNDQLRGMPPTVVKDFVSHYEEIGSIKVQFDYFLVYGSAGVSG